jgi:hypothetical protein
MNLPLERLRAPRAPNDWKEFLEENIFADESPDSVHPRHEVILDFCTRGLGPFLESFGLTWKINRKLLTSKVLRLLYELKHRHHFIIQNVQYEYEEEYYDHYLYLLNSSEWEYFWNIWKSISDFSEDSFGYKARFKIPLLVWNQISIEHSRGFDTVRIDLDEQHQLEEYLKLDRTAKGKDDPYLQDILHGNIIFDKHYH